MFIFGHLFITVSKILSIAINIYMFLLIVDTVLSWLRLNNYNEYSRFVGNIVEPYLNTIRHIIPRFSSLDFSPLIGILILYFIDEFVINVIREIGMMFL